MRDNLAALVADNLNASLANGYFEPGEQLHGASDLDVAGDLLAYSSDFEDVEDPTVLVPHVAAWRMRL